MAVMTILIVSLVMILTYVQISSQKKTLENELDKRISLMKENLIERGKSLITNLAQQVENDIASFNFSSAMDAVRDRADNNREIKYAILMDASGMTLIHTLKSDPAQNRLTQRDTQSLNCQQMAVTEYKEENGSVIEIVKPIQISTEPWGVLRLIYTLERLDTEISISQKQIENEIKVMVVRAVLTSLGFIMVCSVIVFILSTSLSKPLIHLTHSARSLSKGDFSVSSDIHIRSRDEVGMLAASFVEMSKELEDSYKKLEEYNRTLEEKVEERTQVLNMTLAEVEDANNKIMASIQYAKMIQRSLLPNPETVRTFFPDSFFIWMPRDIVGGDFIFTDYVAGGLIMAVIDCTGHGVPGAFLTMIASSSLRKIIKDEGFHNPAEILQRLSFLVKTTLHQDTDYALSDDGLDAAVCFINSPVSAVSGPSSARLGPSSARLGPSSARLGPSPARLGPSSARLGLANPSRQKAETDRQSGGTDNGQITFAGAKSPLIYIHNDEVSIIKGDRESVGYKRSNLNFSFTNHTVNIEKGMCFYIFSDGFIDQLGGKKYRRFGMRRFKALLRENARTPFEKQREILLQAFDEHQGDDEERQDDVTMVGFGF